MYLSYYGLKEKPFSISTDPKFLWLGEKHREAFSVLKYGVLDNKGFLLLTGDVGAGKTTLIHALTLSLGNDVVWAAVPDPGLGLMEFCQYIAYEFKLDMAFNTKTEFIIIFREFLYAAHKNRKKVLLIVDEAQRLSSELLEEIRMLSNIELNELKLLNIFFVGQIEFNNILVEERNRAVRQRITVSYHIKPLSEKETGMYIRHRLKVAGAKRNIFSFAAVNLIYKYARGCPRVINIICDLAMLIGFSKEIQRIGVDIIDESIQGFEVKSKVSDNEENLIANNDFSFKKRNSLLFYLFVLMIASSLFFLPVYLKWETIVDFIEDFKSVSQLNKTDASADVPPLASSLQQRTPALADFGSGPEKSKNETRNFLKAIVESEKKRGSERRVPPFEPGKIIISFHHDSNEFPENAYQKLDDLSEFMQKHSEICVFITGYTDQLGSYSYNVKLSSFRANIVKSYLIGKGVDRLRIKATGMGSANPRNTNSTVEGRRANRRVEIEVFNYYRPETKKPYL